jgi:hypothetical protein
LEGEDEPREPDQDPRDDEIEPQALGASPSAVY